MIVDAHQHFWDPALADYPWMTDGPLRRRFGPDDLAPLLEASGVDGTVVVQARHSLDETRELLALAAATPFVLGVVGWVDLTGDVAAALAGLEGPLVGVRHLVHDEPDAEWLLRDDVQRGLAAVADQGLAFDLLVRERELPAAAETARRHPQLRFVLDHVAKAPQDAAAHARWRDGVAALAELPNVACKVSGLFTEADPEGTLALALTRFGPERCMFGSDWPVCTLTVDYAAAFEFVHARAPEPVLGETAARVYRL